MISANSLSCAILFQGQEFEVLFQRCYVFHILTAKDLILHLDFYCRCRECNSDYLFESLGRELALFFLTSGHICGIWKFLSQASCHSHCRNNAEQLYCEPHGSPAISIYTLLAENFYLEKAYSSVVHITSERTWTHEIMKCCRMKKISSQSAISKSKTLRIIRGLHIYQ